MRCLQAESTVTVHDSCIVGSTLLDPHVRWNERLRSQLSLALSYLVCWPLAAATLALEGNCFLTLL